MKEENKNYPVKYAILPVKELVVPEFGNIYHGYCTADDLTSAPKKYLKRKRDKKRTK